MFDTYGKYYKQYLEFCKCSLFYIYEMKRLLNRQDAYDNFYFCSKEEMEYAID